MANVGDVIDIALRHCKLAPTGQQVEGDAGVIALAEYNALMHQFSSTMNIPDPDAPENAGFAPQTSILNFLPLRGQRRTDYYVHEDQARGDEFPLRSEMAPGIGALIATRIAPELGQEEFLSQGTYKSAARGYGQVVGAYGRRSSYQHGLLRRDRFWN